ncbi:MAG: guanylate kinase [Candidatus Adiutrix sp.]|jgi:guanylate kinase|nr:guanylate kinase [Candidatus Adiutrix sp.]
MDEQHKRGRLFVLSAPSGAGKSTLGEIIRRRLPELVYSVSYTTRSPRPGETDGVDYNFVSPERFREMIANREFLEWAEVFGRFYGTGRRWVEEKLAAGFDVLADLDVEGAASVRAVRPESTLVFMAPPTAGELRRRLTARRTESPEETGLRLGQARREIERRHMYDFLLVNDDLARAADEFLEIIQHGRGRAMSDTEDFWPQFFRDEALPR